MTTKQRPDLAEITGRWRWQAFFSEAETTLEEMLALDRDCAQSCDFIPSVFVMLRNEVPVGMVAICLDDLAGKPDLNPWLAGLYVEPDYRGQGYAQMLIDHLVQEARQQGIERLSLYSSEAVGFYRKLGWAELESFDNAGQTFYIFSKSLRA